MSCRVLTHNGITAVVLAAGRSRRMGRPKQLLPLPEGGTVLEHVVTCLLPHVEEVLVVVGHLAGQVATVAAGAGARIVINDEVDEGMLASVQHGIRAVDENARGVLLCLGDQPSIDAPLIEAVLAGTGQAQIVIPTARGRGGHPVYLSRRYFAAILALEADTPQGLRTIVRGHPEQTLEIDVGDATLLQDMDTPGEYRREWLRRQHLERRQRT